MTSRRSDYRITIVISDAIRLDEIAMCVIKALRRHGAFDADAASLRDRTSRSIRWQGSFRRFANVSIAARGRRGSVRLLRDWRAVKESVVIRVSERRGHLPRGPVSPRPEDTAHRSVVSCPALFVARRRGGKGG